MFFKNPFKKKAPEQIEYKELPIELEEIKQIKILIDKVDDYASVDRIIKKAKTGNIVFAKIKELRDRNLDELKQAISKIKTACINFDGDIAGVGDEWLIVTPSTAKVYREGL